MTLLLTRIFWLGNGGRDPAVEITRWTQMTVKKGLERNNNGLDIKIPLFYGADDEYVDTQGEFKIKQNDVIKAYCKYTDDAGVSIDTGASSEDLIMIADVTGFESKNSTNGQEWVVNCDDRTSIVLSKIFAKTYLASEDLTAPEIIFDVLNINLENSINDGDFTVQFVNYPDKNGIQQTRPDSSVFPVGQTKSLVWKPLYDWIQELSIPEVLNSALEIEDKTAPANRTYRFYVDELNVFHWFYPDSTDVDYDFNSSLTWFKDGTQINARELESSLKKSTFDNVNMIIHKTGEDLNGIGILDYYYDKTTKNNQLKMVFKPFTDIAEKAKRRMVADGHLIFDEDLKNYDYIPPGSYPVSPFWTDQFFADNADLNSAFRTYCKQQGDQRAELITSRFSNPRWKGSITYTGYKFNPGELLTYSNEDNAFIATNLRLQSITHQITKTDWQTTVDVEEDERAITAGV